MVRFVVREPGLVEVHHDDHRNVIGGYWRGLPNEAVHGLGQMVVAAGLLEAIAHNIVEALGDHRSSRQTGFRELTTTIKRRLVSPGLASCASGSHDELPTIVTEWCDAALAAMERRHPFIHASYYIGNDGSGEFYSMRTHLRPQDISRVDVEEIGDVFSALDRARLEGDAIETMLLHEVRPGVYLNHWVDHHAQGSSAELLADFRKGYPACPGLGLPHDWLLFDMLTGRREAQ